MSKDTQTTSFPVGKVEFAPSTDYVQTDFPPRDFKVWSTAQSSEPEEDLYYPVAAIEAIAKLLSTQAFDSTESETLTKKALDLVAKL